MNTLAYRNGVLREEWDDSTRTYTEYDENGQVTSSRPYTEAENAAADAAVAAEQAQAEAEARQVAQDALVTATLALSEQAHQDGQAWTAPTGAHDAYPLGATVSHGGKTWESLTPFNVWEPGVSGWREVVEDGYPEWVQPTGAHDAYKTGDRVIYQGRLYESLIDGNVWVPADYPAGWADLGPTD